MSMEGVLAESEDVVYARALGARCFLDASTATIWTETEFLVLDVPKGRTGRTVVVTEPGGVLGDVGHLIPGSPRFETNREFVLFLYRAPGNRLRVVGLQQGLFSVFLDRRTGERMVHSSAGSGETVYESDSTPSRFAFPQTRRLGDFLHAIRERSPRR